MKKVKVIFSIVSILAFFPVISFADGWAGGAKIVEIYPSPGSNGVFIKHGSMPNPDNCSSPSYYILEKTNPLFSEIYSLIVAAQARQSTINLQLSGCGGPGSVYPKINQVISY